MPTLGSGDDVVRIGLPAEWLGSLIVVLDEPLDGRLQRHERVKDAALEAALGELGEEALDRIEPRAGGGGEVEGPARMAMQPVVDLVVLMRRGVVENHMDHFAGRYL